MLPCLSASAMRSKLLPARTGGVPAMALTDLPRFAAEELNLRGLVLQTEFLVGADRQRLQKILESADKAGCPVLVLVESRAAPLGSHDGKLVDAAVERLQRVAQAAQWLGCSAFAVPVDAPDDDESLTLVAEALKPVSRRAERLDLNLCIVPGEGLTRTPERVAELLKKIGGFRVGTLPDFYAASASHDPIPYLRRLVPYASAVLVPPPSAEPVNSGKRPDARGTVEPKPASKAKGKKKSGVEESDEPALDKPTAVPVAGATPGAFDLNDYLGVLKAIGYEGPVALDYRGPGDPAPGLIHLREQLGAFIDTGSSGIDNLLAALGDGGELDDDEEEPDESEQEH